jgi:DNA (cytosine-5)-methyltransferase 1
MLVHASLFSGIGGFDLAAEWMGWDNLFHCEWNPFGQRVLKHHFPNSISYNDITKTNFTIHEGSVDILTGGFPCQPYSSAGKRLGKEDERHLWPHMLRTIQEIKPRWVVGENVRGLTNWNGGLVFNEVQVELENEGYEVQPYLLPAAGVNAPHRRDRIWFVAYSNNNGTRSRFGQIQNQNEEIPQWNNNAEFSNTSDDIITNSNDKMRYGQRSNNSEWQNKEQKSHNWNELRNYIGSTGEEQNVTNSEQFRLEHGEERRSFNKSERTTQRKRGEFAKQFEANGWSRFPTKPPICGGNDGLPRELDSITFPKWRNESIKAYGNAIVPQVAHQIFKAIEEFELMVNK